MIIGNFTYDAHHDTYSGDITTLTLQRSDVVLQPNDKQGEKEPDYRVVYEQDGALVEFGAAWTRSSERGRNFLSVMLDDPALPSSLNVALFFSDEDERATLVWQRQMKKAPAAESKPVSSRSRKTSTERRPQLG